MSAIRKYFVQIERIHIATTIKTVIMVTKFAYELKQIIYVNKKHKQKRKASTHFKFTLFKSFYTKAS